MDAAAARSGGVPDPDTRFDDGINRGCPIAVQGHDRSNGDSDQSAVSSGTPDTVGRLQPRLRKLAEGGHAIGNHASSHPFFDGQGEARAFNELLGTGQIKSTVRSARTLSGRRSAAPTRRSTRTRREANGLTGMIAVSMVHNDPLAVRGRIIR